VCGYWEWVWKWVGKVYVFGDGVVRVTLILVFVHLMMIVSAMSE
jgi:hypothetical protein